MSVQSEITRINNNVANAYSAVGSKGGTLPTVQNSANLAAAINSISGGAYDVTQTIDGDTCTLAIVDAQGGGSTPTGEISITENGTYDVTNYANANVNVSGGGGGLPELPPVSEWSETNLYLSEDMQISSDYVLPSGYNIYAAGGSITIARDASFTSNGNLYRIPLYNYGELTTSCLFNIALYNNGKATINAPVVHIEYCVNNSAIIANQLFIDELENYGYINSNDFSISGCSNNNGAIVGWTVVLGSSSINNGIICTLSSGSFTSGLSLDNTNGRIWLHDVSFYNEGTFTTGAADQILAIGADIDASIPHLFYHQ